MKGYKGFDKDLKCLGMQYAIGETKTHTGDLSLCSSGLHFTEHPLDTWSYYKPTGSRFAEIEADGVSSQTERDSKRVAQSLTVKAELKIPALIKAAVEFVFSKVKSRPTTHATTGNFAHSATTGYLAQASVKGAQSVAASLGRNGKAKGPLKAWLVLSDIDENRTIKAMGIARVDGKRIKADTFYSLKGGKFIESE
jgi:hypothetical protein